MTKTSHTRSRDPRVLSLASQFHHFRKISTPGQRVPAALREAVIRAIDDGVPPPQIRSACRITKPQLQTWRRKQDRLRPRTPAVDPVVPTVLDVVSDDVTSREHDKLAVRFQLGDWLVTIEPLQGRERKGR